MINAGGVSAFLDLDTGKFNSGMAAAQGKMDNFAGKMGAMGDKVSGTGKKMTMGLTVPILGIGTAATKLGMDFEAGMDEVAAISGATGDELVTLEKLAREMGSTTKFSASEAAEGLKYMAM